MNINYKINNQGFEILIREEKYAVVYEKDTWEKLSSNYQNLLAQNLTLANTHFLPLMFNEEINYDFSLPISEPYFFKNQLYDLLSCEIADEKETLEYLRNFYNIETKFEGETTFYPTSKDLASIKTLNQNVIIPFSFGKESLLTLCLCRELKLNPIIMYCQEPVQPYEESFKREKLEELKSKYNINSEFIINKPGLFRYGKAFNLKNKSEVGWGSQTTILALMAIPLAFKYGAKNILFGSEHANNEYRDSKGWKAYLSYDQTSSWIKQQNNLTQLFTLEKCGVHSSLENLEEINIFFMLHHRYPEMGKYQFSCMAEKELLKDSQWCHQCHKCARIYLFAKACGIEPKSIGFKEDLLSKDGLFENYFGSEFKSGSQQELDFAFYVLHKKGNNSKYAELFRQKKLKNLKPWNYYLDKYTSLLPEENLFPQYKEKLNQIFKEELKVFRKLLENL